MDGRLVISFVDMHAIIAKPLKPFLEGRIRLWGHMIGNGAGRSYRV